MTKANEAKVLKAFEKHIDKLKVPNGWIGTMYQHGDELEYTVTNSIDIKIHFYSSGRGKTAFKVDKGWLTFDRHGVEASFYHMSLFNGDKPDPINDIFAAQLKRIAERQEYYKTAIQIPTLPHTTSPEGLPKLKEQLKKSGQLMFNPAGFGTGYHLSTKRTKQWGERRADPELEKFLDQTPIWLTTVEMD
jgi:hypothetical protein